MVKKIISLLVVSVLLLSLVSCRGCPDYYDGDDISSWKNLSQFGSVFTTTK